jgi:hypothetical protein
MPRPLDDAIALRQALRLETAQPGFDVVAVDRRSERRRVVGRLGHSGRDMGPRHEGRIADDGDPAECEAPARQIVNRLQDRLLDQPHDVAQLRRQ